MIRRLIGQVVRGEDLSPTEMTEAMELILTGQIRPTQSAALLVALRMKGETEDEIVAAAQVIRRHSPALRVPAGAVVLDRDEINLDEETVTKTCSLDGAQTRTFNISTATALVAAGGGLKVAKCGARTESTLCGSANVVTALGVNLELTLTEVERCIEQVGLGFLYAHLFHTPMAHPTRVREEIGLRTIFNRTLPLTNPAGVERQVLGVYEPRLTEFTARILKRLGAREAMVIHGQDTLDELSVTGPSVVTHLHEGELRSFELVPEDLGLRRASGEEIAGGDAEDNARIIRAILAGETGARRDVVLLNAAAAFQVAGRARDMSDGLDMAREAIDSGRARAALDELLAFTAKCGVYQHRDVS